jgi:hypothetical protein
VLARSELSGADAAALAACLFEGLARLFHNLRRPRHWRRQIA